MAAITSSGRVVWINARRSANFDLSDMLEVIARRLGRGDLDTFTPEQKVEAVLALIQVSPALIVLDNFEMIEPEEQNNCEKWLAENVSCPVLITTRERINSPLHISVKTRNIAVGKMTLAEAQEFLAILIKQDEHNKSVFAGLDHDRIIKAAEYNPLVLRWIVGQIVGAQSPDDVLDELAQGKGDAAEHVFDHSFNLPQVGDDGRNVLLALYLFSFSASRPALAWVAGLGDDVERFNKAVKKLSELWLVETRENNKKFIVKGLTRERIKKHLDESGRADEFRQRFIEYFLKYAEDHARHSEDDFRALEYEKENGEAAMNMALRHKDWKSVIKFFVALREFLDRHNYWGDLISLSEHVLKAAQKVKEEGLIANDAELTELTRDFPNIIGIEHQNRDRARQTYLEALRFYKAKWKDTRRGPKERRKYVYRLGITAHQIGVMRQYEGESRKAEGWYRWAWRFLKESKSQRGMGAILNNRGVIAEQKGNFKEAADLYSQALKIFNELKPPSAYAIIAEKNLKRAESLSA
jgi:tetratricopeptide (TPR) repeat protein